MREGGFFLSWWPLDDQYVEASAIFIELITLDEVRSCESQFVLFGPIDCLGREEGVALRGRADLDEDETIFVEGNDVEFSVLTRIISLENLTPAAAEKVYGRRFGTVTKPFLPPRRFLEHRERLD